MLIQHFSSSFPAGRVYLPHYLDYVSFEILHHLLSVSQLNLSRVSTGRPSMKPSWILRRVRSRLTTCRPLTPWMAGITLHHFPGHTDGLIGMQLNRPFILLVALYLSADIWFPIAQYRMMEHVRSLLVQLVVERI